MATFITLIAMLIMRDKDIVSEGEESGGARLFIVGVAALLEALIVSIDLGILNSMGINLFK